VTSSDMCAKCAREFQYSKFIGQREDRTLVMSTPAALVEAAIRAKNKFDQARARGVTPDPTPADSAPGRAVQPP